MGLRKNAEAGMADAESGWRGMDTEEWAYQRGRLILHMQRIVRCGVVVCPLDGGGRDEVLKARD